MSSSSPATTTNRATDGKTPERASERSKAKREGVSPSAPKPVRVRFAPSPTGYLHVGGIRSGLFNWLIARHTGGSFILRIEDTDRQRLVEGAIDQINDSFEALGITPDEGPRQGGDFGPYVQSERVEIYREHAKKLLDSGRLYRCWCSPERLDALRATAQAEKRAFKYDRHCLDPENQRDVNEPHVLRFRIPDEPEHISWDDVVRGRLTYASKELDDFVAVKTDGFPTYHFANVVDDHLMAISHVLRADEWLPSTPKHLLLFEAFGWTAPEYVHLPPVQGPTGGKKLSKRDGAQSVSDYTAEGYLPEALMSFLASLGWNDGTTQEVFSPDELIAKFSLDRVQKSPARFDKDRLTWINGYMIRQMPLDQLAERCADFWPAGALDHTPEYRREALRLVQDRMKFLGELSELTDFFFVDPVLPNDFPPAEHAPLLRDLATTLETTVSAAAATPETATWTEAAIESVVRDFTAKANLKPGQFFGTIRRALTGKTAAPGLFETIVVLGRDATLRRLRAAANNL